MINLGKVITAMVTPFDKEENVDYEKTTELIEYLIENGTDALVVAGTTGESPTLSIEEKLGLFKHSMSVVNGRIPVIAGTGSNNTKDSIKLTKLAEEIGVDAVMLVVPFYNKPNQSGIYEHFKVIAESTKLPVMLYNVPGRTVASISVDTVVRLSKIDNIFAIKEASGDLVAMTEIITQTADDFALYTGDDGITLPTLAIGGTGVISVASHVLGNEMQEMISAFTSGDLKKAQEINGKLVPKMTALFMAPNPIPVKEMLRMKGIDTGPVRLPLVALSSEERNKITNIFNN